MNNDPYREFLDDPSQPFEERWKVLLALDEHNQRAGIYATFFKLWNNWFQAHGQGRKKISILEVGSGSGGLSLELFKWGQKSSIHIDLHLFEAQPDILTASAERFLEVKPTLHVATDRYLDVFHDRQFDFVISLHVLHHIQPREVALSALEQMLRISSVGPFVADIDRRWWSTPFAIAYHRLFEKNLPRALKEDGIKSVRRSFDSRTLLSDLLKSRIASSYEFNLKRFYSPYFILRAHRRTSI